MKWSVLQMKKKINLLWYACNDFVTCVSLHDLEFYPVCVLTHVCASLEPFVQLQDSNLVIRYNGKLCANTIYSRRRVVSRNREELGIFLPFLYSSNSSFLRLANFLFSTNLQFSRINCITKKLRFSTTMKIEFKKYFRLNKRNRNWNFWTI